MGLISEVSLIVIGMLRCGVGFNFSLSPKNDRPKDTFLSKFIVASIPFLLNKCFPFKPLRTIFFYFFATLSYHRKTFCVAYKHIIRDHIADCWLTCKSKLCPFWLLIIMPYYDINYSFLRSISICRSRFV